MCCSTARHCWALTRSNHPHSHEYTDMQPFVMQHFQGCRASLESLCINFGGELSTIATLMFAVLHMLLNDLVLSLIFHWVYTILFIQKFWNFHQIKMISTLVHSLNWIFTILYIWRLQIWKQIWTIFTSVRLNFINHLVGFILCRICLYFSN